MTVFHSLIDLIAEYIPAEARFEFYRRMIEVLEEHSVKLDFLVGQDKIFDEAWKCTESRDET